MIEISKAGVLLKWSYYEIEVEWAPLLLVLVAALIVAWGWYRAVVKMLPLQRRFIQRIRDRAQR